MIIHNNLSLILLCRQFIATIIEGIKILFASQIIIITI